MKHVLWFRMYHEARNDPKLDLLDDAQFRVWHRLLCFASEQEERGVIPYRSLKLLAIQVSRGDVELLRATLTMLEELEIIAQTEQEIAFLNWIKRQYDKPSDTPAATRERKQHERESRDVTPMSRDVTPQSRTIEEGEEGEEDKRGKNKREEEREKRSRASQAMASSASPVLSESIVTETEKAANLYGGGMQSLVAEYVPKLIPLGLNIVFEAGQWRADFPQGRLKNFRNWLDKAIEIQRERQPATISPTPKKPEIDYDDLRQRADAIAHEFSANGHRATS